MTTDKKIIAIWAQAENGVIGKKQTMPWHLPAEFKHFKETTMGQAILMGRVTFDGMNRRVLPGREILILTHDLDFKADGVRVVHSVDEAMSWFNSQDKNLYIAGGSAIYKAFEPYYQQLIQTTIHATLEGDTYFPDISKENFVLVSEQVIAKDDQNAYDFTIAILDRKGKA